MRARGRLHAESDPAELVTMSSIQGGLLLAQMSKHACSLRLALDAALIYPRTYGSVHRIRRSRLGELPRHPGHKTKKG